MATHHTNDGAIHLSHDYEPRSSPLVGFPEPPPWMVAANCASTDPNLFFPEKGGSTREAKKVCSRSTVQAECLTWALDSDERFGVFGGLSERERRRVSNRPRLCKYIDCTEPIWARAAIYCATHRPGKAAS